MFTQVYMPEGYNQTLCKNFDELLKAYENHQKICAKALFLDPSKEELIIQVCEDNSVQAIISFDKISFAEKSLVGSYINCSFATKPKLGEIAKFTRDTTDAEEYCRKNYLPNTNITGKVLTFLSYGTMVDIGGGFCVLLPNAKVLNGINHGTELFKKNEFIKLVVNENTTERFNVKVV